MTTDGASTPNATPGVPAASSTPAGAWASQVRSLAIEYDATGSGRETAGANEWERGGEAEPAVQAETTERPAESEPTGGPLVDQAVVSRETAGPSVQVRAVHGGESRQEPPGNGSRDDRAAIETIPGPTDASVDVGRPTVDLDPEETRRAALVKSLPEATDETPLMAELKQDARRRIELPGRRFPRPPSTRVVTVANQKGGVGKTTTTVNLAAALAQAGLNVLVLDNDPQGNASTALGVDHHRDAVDLRGAGRGGADRRDVQESPDVPNLWCLPATIDLVRRRDRARLARRPRDPAAERARRVPGQRGERARSGSTTSSSTARRASACSPSTPSSAAREVLIPIQCEYYALEGLSQLLKTSSSSRPT